MDNTAPTTVQLSLPEDQLKLLRALKEQNEKLLGLLNRNAWVDENEASERLRVSKATIQRWRKAGWLRHYRDGEKIVLYRTDQLDADVERYLGVKKYR